MFHVQLNDGLNVRHKHRQPTSLQRLMQGPVIKTVALAVKNGRASGAEQSNILRSQWFQLKGYDALLSTTGSYRFRAPGSTLLKQKSPNVSSM